MKNLGEMMQQVRDMQERMREVQDRLETLTVTGEAGAGMVTVTLNGKGDMKAISIDDSLIKPGEREMIEDLVLAAFAMARSRLEELVAKEMSAVTGGLPLPPGFQMPG